MIWSSTGTFHGCWSHRAGLGYKNECHQIREEEGWPSGVPMGFQSRKDSSQECNDMNRVSSLEAGSVLMLYGATSLSPHNDSVR